MKRRNWRDERTGVLCFARCAFLIGNAERAHQWAAARGRTLAEYRQLTRHEVIQMRKRQPRPGSTVTLRSGGNIVDLGALRRARAVAS